jgi:hypothetical protein
LVVAAVAEPGVVFALQLDRAFGGGLGAEDHGRTQHVLMLADVGCSG